MSKHSPWMDDEHCSLLTDLYELTMLQAYWYQDMHAEATFSLFSRKMPKNRNYLLFCGLRDVLRYLENLSFSPEAIDYLSSTGIFKDPFLKWLDEFSFTGDVYAMPEGTPFFANEPVLEVKAPISQAQLAETYIMNQVHHQTLIASKAARVVAAASSIPIVDFGLRRMHGTDAGIKAVPACYIAGIKATSNVFGGFVYGVPISGTMAHSYIQAHEKEIDALREFTRLYPDTILLVDTYDIQEGIQKVIHLAQELGEDFQVSGVRIDSSDLSQAAKNARQLLDQAGLNKVSIFASGGLDEYKIQKIVQDKAPVDGFGVGTKLGVSQDVPSLDMVYKLSAYKGQGRLKTSPGKETLPWQKQVFRQEDKGQAIQDTIGRYTEELPGRPLLQKVMHKGEPLSSTQVTLDETQKLVSEELSKLPSALLELETAEPGYPVRVSDKLHKEQQRIIQELQKE